MRISVGGEHFLDAGWSFGVVVVLLLDAVKTNCCVVLLDSQVILLFHQVINIVKETSVFRPTYH